MKRILIALLAFGLMASAQAQEKETPKWRTLTFTAIENVSLDTGDMAPQLAVALDYELAHGFAISSWNGMSYNTGTQTSWFASQTTLDHRVGKKKNFAIGLGYLYSTNGLNSFVPVAGQQLNDELFLSLKLQYRIKL